jgi:hypothetical protein
MAVGEATTAKLSGVSSSERFLLKLLPPFSAGSDMGHRASARQLLLGHAVAMQFLLV